MDGNAQHSKVTISLNLIKKIKIEFIFIILFIIILMKFLSSFNGGLIIHPAPYNYNAGDMFTYAVYAEVAKFENDASVVPFYLSQRVEGIPSTLVAMNAFISAELSLFTGIESYEFLIHSTLLFITLSIVMLFYFLSKINLRLAVLAFPLSLLVFKWPFQYAITWGMCGSSPTMFFAIVGLFCIKYLNKRYIFIVLGIMNGAGFLAHARETLMFNLGVALYFLIQLIKEKIPQDIIKNPSNLIKLLKENEVLISLRNYFFSIPITLLMMFRYIPILSLFLFAKSAKYGYGTSNNFITYMPPWLPHHVYFHQFGFFEYLIFAGAAIGLCFLIFKKVKEIDMIIAFALMFLFNGFFSVLGNKTTQIPHLFPVLLMPFAGLALFIVYLFIKKIVKWPALIFSILFLFIFIPTVMHHSPGLVSDYAFSDPYTWEGFKWIRNNVADNENVFVLYGDRHNQDTLFYMLLKNSYRLNLENYIEQVSKGNLTSNLPATGYILAEYFIKIDGKYVYRTNNSIKMNEPLCYYDYIYSNKISRIPQIQKYTLALLDKLVKESNFVPVFQNELIIILKNNNVGRECFKDEVLA